MELRNAKKDENEITLEASVVENEKSVETSEVENDIDAGKGGEVVVVAEAGKDDNEAVQTSAREGSNEKFVETSMDAKQEPSVLASVEASSSGIKKPKGLLAKKKIVKKVKKLVKKKSLQGTDVQVAGEENVAVEQGIKEAMTVEQSAEPSFVESKNKVMKAENSVADGKEKDAETSFGNDDTETKKELDEVAEASAADDEKVAGVEPSGQETPAEVKGKASILKSVEKRLLKGKKFKGILVQPKGMDKDSSTLVQGPKEGVDLDSMVADKKSAGASTGGNVMEAEKVVEVSVESPENALSVEKQQPKKLGAKAKLRKTPPAMFVKTDVDIRAPQVEQNDQEKNGLLAVNEQRNDVEKLNQLQVNTSEAEKNKPKQLTEDKTVMAENKRRKKRRRGKQVLGSNKKQRNEVVAVSDVTRERMEEKKERLADPENREKDDGHDKAKIAGLIFMCNAKTRPDCFRFSVMGVQEKRKDYVMGIKPGIKLFLYDYDLKLLYGIFQASSAGGMKLERNAFGGSFPAQVRFKVVSDCLPLPESQFKKAIKENYNNRNKFKTELTRKQISKLMKLFRPATLPAQLTHTLPTPAPRDAERKRPEKDRYASGSSRTHLPRTHERSSNATNALPLREEPPRDLYLSEREYRTYGLRRGETSQHYQIPPPDSSFRDRVPLDSYRPSLDHDRLLRNAEMERSDRREVRLLHLPGRDYHPYERLSSRREVFARDSPDPPVPAIALDSYRRDPHYRYEYRSPERLPRTYLASLGREDDDLYSRYVTADSLAEYYRSSSHRYPSVAESELPPSSVTSRYAYSGSLPYSHRL